MLKLLLISTIMFSTVWADNFYRSTRDYASWFGPRSYGANVTKTHLELNITESFLQIEEEVTLEATISSTLDGDEMSLEFFGTFELPAGSIIRSSVLFFGDDLLKAKLLDATTARELYEEVVDRDEVIDIPVDPSLIEKIGTDEYSYSIYPVEWGETRTIRIRYDIPLNPQDSIRLAEVASIFNSYHNNPSGTVSLKLNSELDQEVKLQLLDQKFIVTPGYEYEFDMSDVFWLYGGARLSLESDAYSYIKTTQVDTGSIQGYYHEVLLNVPKVIQDSLGDYPVDFTSQLKISHPGANRIMNLDTRYLKNKSKLRIFIRSEAAWEGEMEWMIFDPQGELYHSELATIDSLMTGDSSTVILWSNFKGYSFGHHFGYVDENMSLLALEEDALPDSLKSIYWDQGVPLLGQDEIISEFEDVVEFDKLEVVVDGSYVLSIMDVDIQEFIQWELQGDALLFQLVGNDLIGAQVKAINLEGQVLKVQTLNSGSNSFELPSMNQSEYVVLIEYSGKRIRVEF